MIFTFLNGSSTERQWFRETCDRAWSAWYTNDEWGFPRVSGVTQIAVRCDVEWVSMSEDGTLTYAYDALGMTATMSLRDDLVDAGEAYFKEAVMHQVAHMAIARQIEPYPNRKQTICDLVGQPLSEWDTGAWEDQVKEGAAEIYKDGLAAPGQLASTNRTNVRLQLSGDTAIPGGSAPVPVAVEFIEFCDQFRADDMSETHTVTFAERSPTQSLTTPGEVEVPYVNDYSVYVLHIPLLPGSYLGTARTRFIKIYDVNDVLLGENSVTSLPTNSGGSARFGDIAAGMDLEPLTMYDSDRLPLKVVTGFSGGSVAAEVWMEPTGPSWSIDPPPFVVESVVGTLTVGDGLSGSHPTLARGGRIVGSQVI